MLSANHWPTRLTSVLGVAALFLAWANANAVSGTNLLANPGFEDGRNEWRLFETGRSGRQGFWNHGPAKKPVRNGSGSFKSCGGDFDNDRMNFGGVYQTYESQPGAVYASDAWIFMLGQDRVGPDDRAFVAVDFLDASRKVVGLWRSPVFDATWPADTWCQLAVTNQYNPTNQQQALPATAFSGLIAPPGTALVRCRLAFIQNHKNGGAVFWDDASLVQIGGPTVVVSAAQNIAYDEIEIAKEVKRAEWIELVQGIGLLTGFVGGFACLPWGISALLRRFIHLPPLRKKNSILTSWLFAVLSFVGLAFVIGMLMFALAVPLRDLGLRLNLNLDIGLGIYLWSGLALVSILTGMAYRRVRWERTAAANDNQMPSAPVTSPHAAARSPESPARRE